MERVLVTGGSGLLGSRITWALDGRYEVFYTFNRHDAALGCGTGVQLDISSAQCARKIAQLKPSVVFNTAAITDVDYCESHREEALAVNAKGAENVASGCREAGAKMVHLSTDYVFGGTKGGYVEDDAPAPINYYGLSKLQSERAVASVLEDSVIARTTVIFGWNRSWQRNNFATWVIRSLREGRGISLVKDQFSNPTLVEDLAGALIELAERNKRGVYHTVGRDCLSRYDFGLEIAKVFGLDAGLIRQVTSEELAQPAPRPKNNCLSCKKAAGELGARLSGAKEALLFMKRQEEEAR